MIEPVSPNETMIAEASSAQRRPDESVELELLIRRAYDDKRATIKFALSAAGAEALISNLTHPTLKSDTKHDDLIDRKFMDVTDKGFENFDIAVPKFTEAQPIPPKRRMWLGGLFLLAGASLVFILMHAAGKKDAQVPEDPLGWSNLSACAFTSSFDQTKELNLYYNSRAVLYDKSIKENGKYRTVVGSWAFDETTKRYTIGLNDSVNTYSLVELEGWSSCMLVRGSPTSADLSESWFMIPSDAASDEPPNEGY